MKGKIFIYGYTLTKIMPVVAFSQVDFFSCCFFPLLVLQCDLVEEPFLVVVRDSIIYGISLSPDDKTNDAMVPVAGLQNGYDVDFDDNEQTIYWVEHPVTTLSEIHLHSVASLLPVNMTVLCSKILIALSLTSPQSIQRVTVNWCLKRLME